MNHKTDFANSGSKRSSVSDKNIYEINLMSSNSICMYLLFAEDKTMRIKGLSIS